MCYTYDDRDWVTNRRTVDLVTEEYTDDPFTYDAAGNLQNLIGDNTPTYDSNNRLTEYQGNALHYDAEGNMEVTPFADYYVQHYTYDTKNRLISDQIEFSASYNADNLRYRVTDRDDINLYDHTYLSDTNCRLSRALVRYDNYTDNVTYYLHGLGLVGEYTNGSFKTYHFDYRGSTVAITDNTGNIIDTFEYDTYGKQTARTGNTDTPFRYNGRDGVMTEYNGLLYMRARYYSPDMRRFISADILPGGIDNAVTLNRYAYANANPVTNIDPFGLCAERGQLGPTALEAAYMAQHIYNPSNKFYYNHWVYEPMLSMTDDSGVVIGVYSRYVNGKIEYTLVNKGSSTATDWKENILQPFGMSKSMQSSIKFAKEFVESYPEAHITFVGHSKGGAEAMANAVATNKDAIVFNPAKANYAAYGLNTKAYTQEMTSYVVFGEILSDAYMLINTLPLSYPSARTSPFLFDDFLTLVAPIAVHSSPEIGEVVYLPNPKGHIVQDHSMVSVIDVMKKLNYQ